MRVLDFNDGFNSSQEPVEGYIAATGFRSYASTDDFVAAKGSPAANGDVFFNTTTRLYQCYYGNTASWQSFPDSYDLNTQLSSLQSQIDARATSIALTSHENATNNAHPASAIANTPSGNVASTDLQSAVNELQSDIDTRATSSSVTSLSGRVSTLETAVPLKEPGLGNPSSDGYVLSSSAAGVRAWVAPGGTSSSAMNFIINGNFDFWQRVGSSSISLGATSAFAADRFPAYRGGSVGAASAIRSTDVPNLSCAYSLQMNVDTANASPAAGDYFGIDHRIEGNNILPLIGNAFTISFWVKSSVTGTYTLSLQNSGNDRSYVTTYTINLANTWEQKSITVPAFPTAGTWNYGTGTGLFMHWYLIPYASYQTSSTNSWLTGNYQSASGQVNLMASPGNTFRIAQIMLNLGSSAAGFQRAGGTFGGELARCQRYFEIGGSGSTCTPSSSTAVCASISFKVPKRTTATPGLLTGSFRVSNLTTNYDAASPSISGSSNTDYGSFPTITGFTGLPATYTYMFVVSNLLTFSAEL